MVTLTFWDSGTPSEQKAVQYRRFSPGSHPCDVFYAWIVHGETSHRPGFYLVHSDASRSSPRITQCAHSHTTISSKCTQCPRKHVYSSPTFGIALPIPHTWLHQAPSVTRDWSRASASHPCCFCRFVVTSGGSLPFPTVSHSCHYTLHICPYSFRLLLIS